MQSGEICRCSLAVNGDSFNPFDFGKNYIKEQLKSVLMEKLGIIGGSVFFGDGFLNNLEAQEVETPYGKVDVLAGENLAYIQRHGKSNSVPPHKINHRANMAAFGELGIKKVIGINSAGSLRSKTRPGAIIIPKDYIDFNPVSFFEKEIKHAVPGLDKELRGRLAKIAKKEKISYTDWEIYYQTRGPRLETKAEVSMIKNYAQIVGMTMGSEATLAKETGIKYAAVCSVDNYANGIVRKELTEEQILENRKKNAEKLKKFIEKIVEDFSGKGGKKPEQSSGPIYDFIKNIRGV